MTFISARQRLKKLAGDIYCSTCFEVSDHHDKTTSISCRLYIAEVGWFQGPTWEVAFKALEDAMHGLSDNTVEEQAPVGEY